MACELFYGKFYFSNQKETVTMSPGYRGNKDNTGQRQRPIDRKSLGV